MRNAAILATIAIMLILSGARLYERGLCAYNLVGEYSYFTATDEQVTKSDLPILNMRGTFERVDMFGDKAEAEKLILDSAAQVLGKEETGDRTIIYAFCPRLGEGRSTVYGEVNLMICYGGGRVAVGSPLLKGSL